MPNHLAKMRNVHATLRAGSQGRGEDAPSLAWSGNEITRFLDDTFGRRNWGHTGLLPALHDLGIHEARWTPERNVHSVWDLINHIAHWKRYTLRRIQGSRPKSYQAWPPPGRTADELGRAVAALRRLHREMRKAVNSLRIDDLAEKNGGRYPLAQLILGEAAHEAYHIGQILLMRRLYRRRARL